MYTDAGSATNYPPFYPLPLVACTRVSVVTEVGTGRAVHVIFSSHIDSQSLSFHPLPLLFPLLTAGPFLPLLPDREGSSVYTQLKSILKNEQWVAFLDPVSGGLYFRLIVILPDALLIVLYPSKSWSGYWQKMPVASG